MILIAYSFLSIHYVTLHVQSIIIQPAANVCLDYTLNELRLTDYAMRIEAIFVIVSLLHILDYN